MKDAYELSADVYDRFRALVLRESGMALGPHKRALLVSRLTRRLRELGIGSLREYYARVVDDEGERARMLDRLCTNETRFFREPRHFAFLADVVFPAIARAAERGERARRLRLWSAACSSGEEPYSLAMCALFHLPAASGWEVEIAASDLSTTALARARKAVFPIERAADIPERYLKAFMLRGTGARVGRMKAGPELRAIVRFSRVNLNDDSSAALGRFDAVFCRNVLIYFDPEARRRAIERLFLRLEPHGYLFLGHAESLSGVRPHATCVAPNVYAQ
jgi:chemotaxis protein methyltransferase CheR